MKPIIGITQDIELKEHEPDGFWAYLDRHYAEAVHRFGGMPMMIPALGGNAEAHDVAGYIDGLLLSGGDDIDPKYYNEAQAPVLTISPDIRTDYDFALIDNMLRLGKPVLGICLGIQEMNVFFGGTLRQDIPGHKEKGRDMAHAVEILPGGRLAGLLGAGRITVNSYHHQALGDVSPRLFKSAAAADGIVEAVELPGDNFVVGVQWHPERMQEDGNARRLFEAFIEASRGTRP